MKRRSFISASLASLLAVGVFYVGRWFRNSDGDKKLVQPRFLSLLCDENTIRMLGRSYLQSNPDEIKADRWLDDLIMEKSHDMFLKKQSALIAESQIEKKIKHDFDNENIVVVQGWVLSITEARQCALFSMINS